MSQKDSFHWVSQRLSGIALVPLSLFSLYKIITAIASKESILSIAASPFSLFVIVIFAIISFYHASLGFDVIIDDYVACNFKKHFLKALIKFLNISTLIFFIFASYSFFQKQEISIQNNDFESPPSLSSEKSENP
jgi:succinate dehydrogenase hydrophobic membrane anchor protein